MTISQWMRVIKESAEQGAKGKCVARQDLPWTADLGPSPEDQAEMRGVCTGCPILKPCAGFGLTEPGGFYAGVWIPWKSESDDLSRLRARAREHLRTIVAPLSVLA